MMYHEWEIDPILGTYDDLIEAFLVKGYNLEEDLFLFPYQWRDSNADNAILLKDRINEIKNQTNSNKVDIVAHSMGGLLAREYLESDDFWFRDDVDQFITLGTPHNGAPETYLVWEAGEFGLKFEDYLTKLFFNQEAEEAGYDDLFDYIRNRPISSVQELLPTYEYLWDKDLERYKEYPEEYPRNEFLENLNSSDKIENLRWLEFINIYGNVGDSSTINEIKVINETIGDLWEHGYPDGFDKPLPIGDRGFVEGLGDETVPTVSALYPSAYATYNLELDFSHGDLPADAQQDVLEFLTGERPVQEIEENSKIMSLIMFFVFSPIDIQIVLEDGRKIGTDPKTGEIVNELEDEGAYYSGNNTENEFITIPNYLDGKYQILTSGTDGGGDFRVETIVLKTGEEEVSEELIDTISGSTIEGEVKNFEVQIGEESSSEENNSDSDENSDENNENHPKADDSEESEDDNDDNENDSNNDNENESDEESTEDEDDASSDNEGDNEDENDSENDEETSSDSESEESSPAEATEDDEESSSDDENDDEDDPEADDSEESKDNNGRALGHIKQQAKKQQIAENKEIKKQQIQDKKIAQTGSLPLQGQTKQTKVAGTQKNSPKEFLIITTLILIGAVALYLTWTVGRKKI